MSRLRALIGPAIVGASVWCAAGTLTVATAENATVRFVVPAAWWWLVASAVLAAAVRPWRQRPVLATPALLATLPWWPIPLPSVALIWTGPLAWLPIGLAALGAAVVAWSRLVDDQGAASASARVWAPAEADRGAPGAADPTGDDNRVLSFAATRSGMIAAGVLTLLAALVTFWSLHPRLPGGDEPAYLVITQSLLIDGDVRIENNHARRDYAAYFAGNLKPDFIQRGLDGQIYSIHALGVSVVVLPAFALAGYRGAVLMIAVLAAITGAIVWLIGLMATGDRTAAWIAWASVTLSTTCLVQSITIFPDGPGALVVAAGIWLLLAMRLTPGRITVIEIAIVSALFAGMPWLHTRFSVLAAGFGALIVWAILDDTGRPVARRGRRALAFAVVPAVSAGLWFLFFQLIYGTPNPSAPYGPDPGTRMAYVPGGLAGLLADQRFGLLMSSPVLAMAAIGVVARANGIARIARSTMLVALAYAAATATYWMWWGGQPVTPARFLAAVLPALAVPVALAWARSAAATRVWMLLWLALSLAMTAALVAVDGGGLAWNVRDTAARWLEWAGPVANLSRAFPSFFWVLRPEDLRTEWPFAIHAGAWVVVFGVAIAGVGWIARLRGWGSAAVAPLVAWTFAVALMAAVSIGWRFTGQPPLDPARSQVSVLRAMSAAARVSRVSSGAVRRVSNPGEMLIAPQRRGQVFVPAAEWALLTGVPAGEYELRLFKPASVSGNVVIRIGRGPHPYRTIPLASLSEQRATLTLAGGARAMTIEPNPALAAAAGRVELRPLALFADARDLAHVAVPYGAVDVFFLDDGAFAEGDGFWVRGGGAAEFVVSDHSGRPVIELALANGATDNAVTITAGGVGERIALTPHETRTIGVPLTGRRVRVRVESPAGFRPSDTGGSADRRYLGVRVVVK